MKYKQIPNASDVIVLSSHKQIQNFTLICEKEISFEFILQIFLLFHRRPNESKLGNKTRFHTFDK